MLLTHILYSIYNWSKFTDSLEHKLTTTQTLKLDQKHFSTRSSSLNFESLKTLWLWSGMFSTHVTSDCFVRNERDAMEHTGVILTPFLHVLQHHKCLPSLFLPCPFPPNQSPCLVHAP